jgi:hypothetical protein
MKNRSEIFALLSAKAERFLSELPVFMRLQFAKINNNKRYFFIFFLLLMTKQHLAGSNCLAFRFRA